MKKGLRSPCRFALFSSFAMRIMLLQLGLILVLTTVANAHLSNGQSVLDRSISVRLTNVPLREALNTLEKKAQTQFVYSSLTVSEQNRVSLQATNETLESVLNRLLKPLNISYELFNQRIILSKRPIETGGPKVEAAVVPDEPVQVIPVRGRVRASDGNEGMPGVSVVVRETSTGTTTDSRGNYNINVPDGNAVLVFSFVGYASQTATVGNRNTIDITLTPDEASLNEVVVIGYGTQKKSDVTGAVSVAELKRVNELPLPSVDQVLNGRIAGAQITQSSGQAGAGTSIRIRGSNSINGTNEPLFVVDGFPIINDNGAYAAGGPAGLTNSGSGNPGQGNPGGALNWLNPADIESVDVLKDASSTAIYGSRGANGVIIITTKRGKAGQARINLTTSYGFSDLNDKNIKMMSASQFAQYDNLSRTGLGQTVFYKDTTVNGKLYPSPGRINQTTNWLDAVTRRGVTQNYSLGFTGGNNVLYSGSLSLFSQQTPLKGSDFVRGVFRLGLQTDLTRWLHLDNSFTYTTSHTDNAPGDVRDVQKYGLFEAALAANPVEPVYNANGSLNFQGGDPSNIRIPGVSYNPLSLATDVLNRNTINTVLNSLSLRATILNGLTFEVRGSVFNNTVLRDIYYNSKTTFNGFQVGGLGGKNTNNATSYLVETFTTFSRNFGPNAFNAVLGYSYQLSDYRSVIAGASGFPNDVLKNEALSSGSTQYPIQTNRNQDILASYFVRLNNVLKDKYLFTFTARYDGSSKFGAGNKFALFPSGAVSWRINQEELLRNARNLSDLKLRFSYGLTGNQAIASGQSQSFLYTTQYPIGGVVQTGVFPGNIGNPQLKWETTSQLNAGLDFGFFQQRFTGSVNYYSKNTNDLLQTRPLPNNSGFGSILTNAGSLSNKGIEVELRGAIINSNKFRWDLSLNFAHNVNKLTSTGLPGVDTVLNQFGVVGGAPAYTALIKGQPIGVFYGYRQGGLFTTQEQLKSYPSLAGSALGSPRYLDLNGDGAITEKDRTVIGNPNPTFTFGIINNFTYGRFDLNVLTQGAVGGNIYNLTDYVLQRIGNQREVAANYYTPSNPNAVYPTPGNDAGRTNFSDFYIASATYLRIKSATLGFNVPMGKIKFLNSIRVFASATNFLTLTKYTGFDPEVSSFGQSNLFRNIDILTVPQFKTYTLGATIGL